MTPKQAKLILRDRAIESMAGTCNEDDPYEKQLKAAFVSLKKYLKIYATRKLNN